MLDIDCTEMDGASEMDGAAETGAKTGTDFSKMGMETDVDCCAVSKAADTEGICETGDVCKTGVCKIVGDCMADVVDDTGVATGLRRGIG
jgi:hypothetical protein